MPSIARFIGRLGVLEKRVLGLVQALLHIHQERRDPLGLLAVEPPREPDELAQITPGCDRSDLNSHPRATLYVHGA
jgi:hypothetical protein